MKPDKPLAAKAYGSIGHLLSSRLGPGDHHVHEGQSEICTGKPRRGDRIIVQEKLDGACMSVANIDGFIVPLTRAGYRARDGRYEHLQFFERYVDQNLPKFDFLKPGERICGEWLAMAHGTRYDPLHPMFEPFIAFDLMRDNQRVLYDEFVNRIAGRIRRAATIWNSDQSLSVLDAMMLLVGINGSPMNPLGFHGALDPVEGAVWRVEREGRVDFLAKYVRQDKADGKYLPDISGQEPIWYWNPKHKQLKEAA
jgi:hypothetical protein